MSPIYPTLPHGTPEVRPGVQTLVASLRFGKPLLPQILAHFDAPDAVYGEAWLDVFLTLEMLTDWEGDPFLTTLNRRTPRANPLNTDGVWDGLEHQFRYMRKGFPTLFPINYVRWVVARDPDAGVAFWDVLTRKPRGENG